MKRSFCHLRSPWLARFWTPARLLGRPHNCPSGSGVPPLFDSFPSQVAQIRLAEGGGTFVFFSLFLAILLLMWTSPAQAKVVSSTELIEHPKKYDGKMVTFRGEVVGDVMFRGNYAWVNVNDDSYRPPKVVKKQKLAGYNQGQSIWIKKEEAQKIIHSGTYKHAGDIVEVIGTFNRACSEHGGDMDIHGDALKIIKRGYLVKRPLQWPKGLAAIGLILLALILFQTNQTLQKKQT